MGARGGRLREDHGPFPWPDGRAAGGRLAWTGVAGLRLGLGGTTVAFDPFASRPPVGRVLLGRPRIDEAAVRARFADLDAVFVGHTHYDHVMDVPAVLAASPRARAHGSRTTVELLRRLGVSPDRLVEVEDGSHVEIGPFVVHAVGSAHGKVPFVRWVDRHDLGAGLPSTPFRYPCGDVLAWRVEAGGRAFHVQGSAGLRDAPLERQARADVLVACLAARKGTPRYLERLGDRLRPAVLVPCHHDDLFRPLDAPPRPVATLRWPRFLEEADAMCRRHGTVLWCPPRDRDVAW